MASHGKFDEEIMEEENSPINKNVKSGIQYLSEFLTFLESFGIPAPAEIIIYENEIFFKYPFSLSEKIDGWVDLRTNLITFSYFKMGKVGRKPSHLKKTTVHCTYQYKWETKRVVGMDPDSVRGESDTGK